ncbi:MAG: killer suppression protein HigA [Chlorobiaceae bacterium]|nr:killer suppression protein HigA [Chlorobiaceae bacterium]
MKLRFSSRKLEKSVESFSAIKKHYGSRAKQVDQRLDDLKVVDCLAQIYAILSANCHELSGRRAGEFAVSISRNHRIIFIPDHDPVPRKDDGGIDLNLVDRIVITAIGEDYH